MTPAQLSRYLQRIGCSTDQSLAPNMETLNRLHSQHSFHIPFENIDVHSEQGVLLEFPHLFGKVIEGQRGGYCFELNKLFSTLLESLGFSLTHHLARVWFRAGLVEEVAPLSHRISVITLEGKRYLADIGFGMAGLLQPICIEEENEQNQFGRRYRYRSHPKFGHLLESWHEKQWKVVYTFDDKPAYPVDYQVANFYTSRYPGLFITQNLVCVISTPTGYKTLINRECKIMDGEREQKWEITTRQECLSVLREQFGIDLPAEARLPGF